MYNTFKLNDIVVCIEPHPSLKPEDTYIVRRINGDFVELANIPGGWFFTRFKLYVKKQTKNKPGTFV